MSPINDDNFNKSFRERFQDFEDSNVSEHNWEAIQSAIPQKKTFFQKNWKKSAALLLFLPIATCFLQSKWQDSLAPNPQITTIEQNALVQNAANPVSSQKTDPSVQTPFLVQNSVKKATINVENKIENKRIKSALMSFETEEINTKIELKNSDLIQKNNAINSDKLSENKGNFNRELIKNNAIINAENNAIINANTIALITELNSELMPKINSALMNEDKKESVNKTELIAFLPLINNEEITTYNTDNQQLIIPNSSFITHHSSLIKAFISWTPQYNFFNFTPNTKDRILLNNFELIKGYSTQRLGMKLETGLGFKLNKTIQINAAINLQNINKNVVYTTQTNVLDSFHIEALNAYNIHIERIANLQKIEEQSNYYLVGFNSSIQLNGKIKGLKYFVASGFGLNKMVNQTQLNATSFDFSVGIYHPLNTRYDVFIAPQITYFMQKNSFSSPVLEAKPYTIGLKLGISRR